MGKVSLAYDIHRIRVKGTGVRLPTNPDRKRSKLLFVASKYQEHGGFITNFLIRRNACEQQSRRYKDMEFLRSPFRYLDPSSMPPVSPLCLGTITLYENSFQCLFLVRPLR